MYDLGEFDQKGSVPTKYGTKEELVQVWQSQEDSSFQSSVLSILQ